MLYRLLADVVLVAHLGFVLFVVAGGFLILRWPGMAWVQLPSAFWGLVVEWSGWICPLTPLENRLRAQGGAAGYAGGFVEHYLVPVLYPASLTRGVQVLLGATVLVINLIAYALAFARITASQRS
ncbi:MAG: DUF2784 domain-containing protein [Deltaproteobacteria bacterium]|nr:MAG: DUF2784 domain-containing protein [Deltaproteobacteria bacterium]TMB32889.1 MAG: DUF2784 domain-containing protein [Deltaproteobacteria bacterium]